MTTAWSPRRGRRLLRAPLAVLRPAVHVLREACHLAVARHGTGKASLSPEERDFVMVNRPFWERHAGEGSEGVILVEGYLASYGPNYLMRTAVSAKAIEKATGCRPVVVFDGYAFSTRRERALYESFGITDFLHLRKGELHPGATARAAWRAARFLLPNGGADRLLALEHQGVPIGDLVYDDILHATGLRTIESVGWGLFPQLCLAYRWLERYQALFRRLPVAYAVVTHSSYVLYGLLARVAYLSRARVFESSDLHSAEYALEDAAGARFPCFHEGVRESIRRQLPGLRGEENLLAAVDEHLEARFSGRLQQVDLALAYGGKQRYRRDELSGRLGIDNQCRNVFIFAHVFVDSPHLSARMLFRDYYEWLQVTLAWIAEIGGVNWIVKPHPSAALYGEAGLVEEMVGAVRGRAGRVLLCPEDFSPVSIRDTADAIITVQGTVGIEYACFGVPSILAGAPFYHGFGFTLEPSTKEEYRALLRGVDGISRLSHEQIDMAKRVFEGFRRNTAGLQTDLISVDILNMIWGYGRERDVAQALSALTANLRRSDPRERGLYPAILASLAQRHPSPAPGGGSSA